MSVANPLLRMPYPGMRPFEAEDQPLFFGREAQVSAMLRQLEDHRFVAVVGSSGSGKSSLVRAGLLPAMHEGFLFGTTDWLTIIIKPGHQPYQRLVRALHQATRAGDDAPAGPGDDAPLAPDESATLAAIRRTDRGLLTVIDQLAISPESRVMIVVDQFEELFAFRRAGANRDSVASRDEAAAFVGMLLRSASEPAGRVWAILTMRSDFIGDCETFLGLPEQISRSQFLVPRLDRGQMEEAITRPAAIEDGEFKTFTFEEGLVNRIINEAGDRPDQLPLMQHALMRTWKYAVARAGPDRPVTVAAEDYEAAGGIEMALSLHADAAWDEIKNDPKKAQLARRLFLLLCDISPDGQITRRRPQVAEVQAVTGASVTEIEQILRVFQQDDRNFLLPPPTQPLTAESYLDISHEALLRQWRRFAGEWQEQERRDASELRRVADLASLRQQGQGVGLLPAQDLERIARWQQRVSPEWARRYVTEAEWDDALGFIAESQSEAEQQREKEHQEAERKRKEEQRQKQAQQKRVFVYALAIILLAATGFSVWHMLEAGEARDLAQIAEKEAKEALAAAKEASDKERAATLNADSAKAELATKSAHDAVSRGLVREIGVSHDFEYQTADERAALWKLAELPPPDAPVREKVIDYWFQTTDSLEMAHRRQAQGVHAAVGLNDTMREYSRVKATELANRLGEALEVSTHAERISDIGVALAGLAAWMRPGDAANVIEPGIKKLAVHFLNSADPGSADLQAKFSSGLAALAPWVDAKRAAHLAPMLRRALENPEETDADHLEIFGSALAALAARMDAGDAAPVADSLTETMTGFAKSNVARLSSLETSLPTLDVVTKFANIERFAKFNVARLSSLGTSLTALAARMDSNGAARIADKLAEVIGHSNEDTMPPLREALVALAARKKPGDAAKGAAPGAEVLVRRMEGSPKTNTGGHFDERLLGLGEALAALAAWMEPGEAARVAARATELLTRAMENSKPTNRLPELRRTLAEFAALREPAEAASTANSLANALENPKETDASRLSSFGVALAALAPRMEPGDAAMVAARGARVLTTALENLKETDADRLSSVGGALAALSTQMEPGEATSSIAARAAKVLATALEKQFTAHRLSSFGRALAALAPRMEPNAAASVAALGGILLAGALENPKEIYSVWSLSEALTELAARMNPGDAAGVATRLAQALEAAGESAVDRRAILGTTLGALSRRIPEARQTHLTALSNMLLKPVSDPPKQGEEETEDRKRLAGLYAVLGKQDLADVLKWPFCVGEAQKLALAELEKKTPGKFGGDLWKFVAQAPALGIKDLNAPAKRPRIEDALEELKKLAGP